MDSLAHFAVSGVLEQSSHYEEALLEAQTSLSLCADAIERSFVLNLKADILFNLEKYKDAQDSINEALAYPDLSASFRTKALYTRARIEGALDHIEESIQAYEESRLADPSAMVPGDVLKEEIDLLERKDANELMSTLRKWSPLERLTWLTWNYVEDGDGVHETFRKAAARTQNHDFLIHVYQEAIELLNPLDSAAPMQYGLAHAHWRVRRDADATKEALDAILNGSSHGYWYALTNEDPTWILAVTINTMSNILYEQFRNSNDPEQKEKLLADARALMQRPLARSLTTGKSDIVHPMVIIARMTRKMGPSRVFRDVLEKAFALCYESLNDSVGWNDSENLESLAEVLLAVDSESLEKEARIAYSAVFSDLEPATSDEPRKGANEDQQADGDGDGDDGSDGNDSDDGSDDDDDDDEDEGEGKDDYDDDTKRSHPDSKHSVNRPEGPGEKFDTSDFTIRCYGTCDPMVECTSGWQGRSMYRCLICYNCYLCEDCYKLRQKLNDGEKPGPIQHFCGANHKYIKGPVEGWKGVKAGKMYIGEDEFIFKDWLRELKEVKWKQVWDTFWTTEA